jgi:hypothetical protein
MGGIARKIDVGTEVGSVIRELLYDTEVLLTNVTYNDVAFFTRQIGQPMNNAVLKTIVETNMQQAGTLGSPDQFLLMGFQVKMINALLAGAGITADAPIRFERTLRATSTLQFGLGGKMLLEIPMAEIPGGLGHYGRWNGIAAANGAAWAVNNGLPLPNNYYPIKVPEAAAQIFNASGPNKSGYILIDSDTAILCRIHFNPGYLSVVAAGETWTIQVRLVGVRLKGLA